MLPSFLLGAFYLATSVVAEDSGKSTSNTIASKSIPHQSIVADLPTQASQLSETARKSENGEVTTNDAVSNYTQSETVLSQASLHSYDFTTESFESHHGKNSVTKSESPIKSPRMLIEEVEQSLRNECPSCPVCSHVPSCSPKTPDLEPETPQVSDYFNSTNQSNSADDDRFPSNVSAEDRGFMSFEEWKKSKQLELEAEAEADKAVRESMRSSSTSSENEKASFSSYQEESSSVPPMEDQGRTYKDKFNYASVDCAATIVKTNSDAKGASSILTEVKDSYLLNKCSSPNKFIVIELCQDILVSSVVVGNFELFSSMFRNVRFSVSDRFPSTNGWQELGEFEAENIRDVQSFEIENPIIWARYLRIEFLTHYGNEFYCPVSVVRVHGTTMIEELKNTDSKQDQVEEEIKNATLVAKPANASELAAELEDECKVVSPYLALNEFLKDFDGNPEFCDVPQVNESTIATGAPSNKGTQESIFQNIMKRLSLLESNATLSLLYVEEQSKLLSDAFISLENRQLKKFEAMVTNFTTLLSSHTSFFEKVVDSVRTESATFLQNQKLELTTLANDAATRSQTLASEVSFLRKIVVVDTIIILSILVYVLVTRETVISEDLFKEKPKHKIQQSPFGKSRGKKRKHH